MKIKIIGAGIFGCMIASELKNAGHEVVLLEAGTDIMQGASKLNHNRIHFGFHYPRSIPTARQSLDGLVSFFLKFKEAIVSGFPNYYMVAKNKSFVTAQEYTYFCDKAEIAYDCEYPPDSLVNRDCICESLKVREPVFDYDILYSIVKDEIKGVDLRLNTPFNGETADYEYIVNASYSNINKVSEQLGIRPLALRFQDVIVPRFKIKQEKIGLTVMDGPFSSIMPQGFNKNTFLLYSPRYSVIAQSPLNSFIQKDPSKAIEKIYTDAQNFYPFLKDASPLGYWRTIRALPINDNDARLSEIFTNPTQPTYINILSGKISTCLKVALEVKNLIQNKVHKSLIV